MTSLDAIIFDFNGVIVDDEHMHYHAFRRSLEAEGMNLDEQEYFDEYLGYDDWGFYGAALERKRGTRLDREELDEWVERKSVLYFEELDRGFELFPGVAALIRSASEQVPLAIASGARRGEIEMILARSGLLDLFKIIVAAEDVTRGKPDPACYLLARRRLEDVLEPVQCPDPTRCLVIEDAPPGIEAALGAGMRCVAVTNSTDRDALGRADAVVDTLEGIGVDDLLRFIG